jgi:hypothetical protein
MKVSDSAPSSSVTASLRGVYLVAGVWLLAHLPFLSPALEDIDSINFALGLHQFDPALHQPHPPGYPVFIALGRFALAIIHVVAPGLSYVRADALALAIWSAIGGAIAIVAAAYLFREMTREGDRASAVGVWGSTMMAATPLFWTTGLRPMSDMCGLGVALAAQALLLRGIRDRRAFVVGALIAGLAAGIRIQTAALTVPLFVYAIAMQRRQGIWLARPIAAFAAGGLAWAVPLVMLTGGIGKYLQALGTQGAEDFAWVDMLWAHPTPKAIVFALYDTFLLPYSVAGVGALFLAIAAVGAGLLLLRDRRALLQVVIAFAPYAVFHLLFQETGNLRYATPLVVPVAFLVAIAATSIRLRASAWPRPIAPAYVPVILGLLALPVQHDLDIGYVFGSEPHPAFRAIDEMTTMAERTRVKPAAVFSHFALRRPLQAAPTKLPVVEPARRFEWLALEDYWLKGGTAPVWFLADPRRTDLALIDPQVRRVPIQYRWKVERLPAFMGTRPMAADWYRLNPPGWFAGEGWELTPETAGIARESGKRLHQQPITAYVRRRQEPLRAIIAGRDLGPANDPASIFEVAIDGAVVDRWRLDPAKDGINFFHVMELPQGIPAGVGNYATLTITARAGQPGTKTPEVAVEQFDLQNIDTPMFGFGEGWQESEYDNAKGLAWRWTSDKATLRIFAPREVRVTVRGEAPSKYFGTLPTVRMRAGALELGVLRTFPRTADFSWTVKVPADALAASGGLVTIETDQVYLPGQAEGTADARRLGLRIFETRVE